MWQLVKQPCVSKTAGQTAVCILSFHNPEIAGAGCREVINLIDRLFRAAWKLIDVNGYSERDAGEMVTKTLFDGIGPRCGNRDLIR